MIPVSEILFAPGAFIGMWILTITCKLGLNLQNMCASDHGSGTSTGEHIFMRIGNVIFWGMIAIVIAAYAKKKFKIIPMKNKTIFTICSGTILLWVSLFLSYRELPNVQDIYKTMATGGFPLRALEYPFPVMGGNWPPQNNWVLFFLNFAVWLIVGFVLSLLFGKRLENKKITNALIILAIFFSVLGLFYIRIKFD